MLHPIPALEKIMSYAAVVDTTTQAGEVLSISHIWLTDAHRNGMTTKRYIFVKTLNENDTQAHITANSGDRPP